MPWHNLVLHVVTNFWVFTSSCTSLLVYYKFFSSINETPQWYDNRVINIFHHLYNEDGSAVLLNGNKS